MRLKVRHYPFPIHMTWYFSEKWQDVYMRLRSGIRDVIHCDVTKPRVLEQVPAPAPYDCVTSHLCLEAACRDEESYMGAVRNLVSLVRPGGHVVLGAVLKESWYERWTIAVS